MKIELKYSNNNLLKKYIHCYYDATIDNENYIAFPNYYIPTCIVNEATFEYSKNTITVEKDPSRTLSLYGVNLYENPIELKFNDNFKTFNIVFKPFGLAQFTKASVDFKNNTLIDYTSIIEPFINTHPSFQSYPIEEKIAHIEDYLLSVLSEKKHTDVVAEKIERWIRESEDGKINSDKVNKTLYRAFKNICGVSPNSMYNVIRLRKAMQDIIEQKTSDMKLSDIAYSLDFFDQSHFTKTFKKLAQKRPKDFSNNLTMMSDDYENENIFFEFIKSVQ